MAFTDILAVTATIITSIGGGGIIVLGLSKWLGEIWANIYMEKHKSALQKDIEKYKAELNLKLENISYITKTQYEKEHSIYLEIWPKFVMCLIDTKALYPKLGTEPRAEENKREYNKEKYLKYAESFNQFSISIENYAPFFQKDIYDSFLESRKLCSVVGGRFEMYTLKLFANEYVTEDKFMMPREVCKEVYDDIPPKLDDFQQDLREKIRSYLLSLRTFEQN